MRLSTTLLISFSLVACGSPNPDTDICTVNHQAGHKKCYNLKKDYNRDGVRNPDAAPNIIQLLSLSDLDKNTCTDPDGFENLLAALKVFRAEIKDLREKLRECNNAKRQ